MNYQDRVLIAAVAGAICSILGKIYIFFHFQLSDASVYNRTEEDFNHLLDLCNYTLIISTIVILAIIIVIPIIEFCIDKYRTES